MPGSENLLTINFFHTTNRLGPSVLRDPFGGLKEVAYDA
jgi:hypothetical protein